MRKAGGNQKTVVKSQATIDERANTKIVVRDNARETRSTPTPEKPPLDQVFERQIERCQCDESKVTIARIEMLSRQSAKRLLVRWTEVCGVIGEGCLR